jgi:hypothetical protein
MPEPSSSGVVAISLVVDSSLTVATEWIFILVNYVAPMLKRLGECFPRNAVRFTQSSACIGMVATDNRSHLVSVSHRRLWSSGHTSNSTHIQAFLRPAAACDTGIAKEPKCDGAGSNRLYGGNGDGRPGGVGRRH